MAPILLLAISVNHKLTFLLFTLRNVIMPMPCYISIEGETQGLITAGASSAESIGVNQGQAGHEDHMLVHEFDHSVTIPVNKQSNKTTGNAVHKPFTFTVSITKSLPLLYNALTTGETLSNVSLLWFRTSAEGKRENFFTTTLSGAKITGIECLMPYCTDKTSTSITQQVVVSMSYTQITWDHMIAGTSGAYDWASSNG